MTFKQELIKWRACKEAIKWAGGRTLKQAWNECPYGDWMLWLLEEMEGKKGWLNKKEIMLLGCWCARRVLKYLPEKETTPLKAIETKEKWARGEITREEMFATIAVVRDAANDVANGITNDAIMDVAWVVARFATRTSALAAIKATTKATVCDVIGGVAWNKESKIQADYIRTQFTPPV